MSHLPTHLILPNSTKLLTWWFVRGGQLCVALVLLLAMSACGDASPVAQSADTPDTAETEVRTISADLYNEPSEHLRSLAPARPQNSFNPLYKPNDAIGKGQMTALTAFFGKQWQLVAINGRASRHMIVVDLRHFGDGYGYAKTECGAIYFRLDTRAVLAGELSVSHIEREITDCPYGIDDDVMRILGDLYGYQRQGDTLYFISLKDKITLTPIT